MAAAQDGEQNQRADDGNDDRAKTAEAVRKESEHPLTSSGDTPSVGIIEQWMASKLNFRTARRDGSFEIGVSADYTDFHRLMRVLPS